VTEFFDNTSLEDISPDYTPNSSVSALVDFMGEYYEKFIFCYVFSGDG